MEKQLIQKIRTLAHKECCNYYYGRCVYDHDCTVINPRYPIVQDGAIGCDYFLQCVLPLDPERNKNVWAEPLREEEMTCPVWKDCVLCGQRFLPNDCRQQYCPHCKPLHEALQPEKTARLLSAQAGERRLIVTGFPFGNPYFIRVPDAVFHKDDPFIVLSKIGGDTGNKNRITK
jgi:hypothetical protein